MIGVEMIKDPAAPDVALGSAMSQACNERGLLVLTCGAGNVVRWIPPLDVQRSEIEQALGIFQEALLATR
jgi:4-aminobutyrate aminotransferase-like enzyme